MELNGQQYIGAARQSVWDALNSPEVLARCVPGCEEIVQVSDTEKHARVLLKIGPVRARFAGKIFMSDVVPPSNCTLSFEGAGGAAGFAKGRSQVTLADEDGGTRLSYTVEASVGGKLGQIGGRLIDASAKKMADEFFSAFNAALTSPLPEGAAGGSANSKPLGAGIATTARPAYGPVTVPVPAPGGFAQELYRAFWFCLGVGVTLLLTRWLH